MERLEPPKAWVEALTELIHRTSTTLPKDVVAALQAGRAREVSGGSASSTLETILQNVDCASERSVPLCQDTGTLTFWLTVPRRTDQVLVEAAVREAVRQATQRGWLRLNVIAVPSGEQISDNVGEANPAIHIHQASCKQITASLLMKGGGCENMNIQYSLPDATLGAGRDLEGVRRCLLDAVYRAQGKGCAPGVLGVCVGGDRASSYAKAKEQLLRDCTDASPDAALAALEQRVFEEANTLGIGPMGLGGETTLLGVKIACLPRLPAAYFVSVAYSCWACRRGTTQFEPVE